MVRRWSRDAHSRQFLSAGNPRGFRLIERDVCDIEKIFPPFRAAYPGAPKEAINLYGSTKLSLERMLSVYMCLSWSL